MSKRKKDHINLALQSQTTRLNNDDRFDYEPLLTPHPGKEDKPFSFLGKTMRVPIWVSSMTGGSEYSMVINKNLARACREFGMGMGLGSCRVLLEEGKYFEQFDLRDTIGDESPFFANLGIKQVEKAVQRKETDKIKNMVHELRADGLIIHVNPIQEWLQPEGDHIEVPPFETIRTYLEHAKSPVIVKEVGQGFGPASLEALLQLPLEAIELAAFGGTNFAKVELNRSGPLKQQMLAPLSLVGNDANQMVENINSFVARNKSLVKCKSVIVSGGIQNFLDGYYFTKKCHLPAIYGQASMFLKHAREDYDSLQEFVQYQLNGLKLAQAYLRVKD